MIAQQSVRISPQAAAQSMTVLRSEITRVGGGLGPVGGEGGGSGAAEGVVSGKARAVVMSLGMDAGKQCILYFVRLPRWGGLVGGSWSPLGSPSD